MTEQEIDFDLLLEKTLESRITVGVCLDCGWIDDHPKIIYCANCPGRLVKIEMEEGDYLRRRHEYIQKTDWQWSRSTFNPRTGAPFDSGFNP